jgi:hypothetical protein
MSDSGEARNAPRASGMFTPQQRDHVRERVLELARSDTRITAAAETGSAAVGAADRWSDVDLAFGVAGGIDPRAVLADWTAVVLRELGGLHHWDLRSGVTLYRVFLLPGGLELDISVTPAAEFGAHGPTFRLLWGESVQRPAAAAPDIDEAIGYGWLFVLNARSAIERGRCWAAEHWISRLRDQTLMLACLRAGLPPLHARGVDRLPKEVLDPYADSLVRDVTIPELSRALMAATERFLDELDEHDPEIAGRLRPTLSDVAHARPDRSSETSRPVR